MKEVFLSGKKYYSDYEFNKKSTVIFSWASAADAPWATHCLVAAFIFSSVKMAGAVKVQLRWQVGGAACREPLCQATLVKGVPGGPWW
jgi:hypothetical protein